MKVREIINEAHHSIIATMEIGDWILDIDSHYIATIADRSNKVNAKEVTSIISFACLYSEELKKLPRGTGAFVQDTVSNISIFLHRYKNQPNRLRLETVLTPDMTPKDRIIRITVPSTNTKMSRKDIKNIERVRMDTQLRGRDSVSQDYENNKDVIDAMSTMDRNQRRVLKKNLARIR
jgi:hypothetical protein